MALDRFDYSSAIADSWKQQTLLNIVKIRYMDLPVFMDVASIVCGYSMQTGVSVNGTLSSQNAVQGNYASIGGQAIYTDRPTITYVPTTGDKFLRGLITPIDPKNIYFLLQSGYAADFILGMAVESLNGVGNRSTAGGTVREANLNFIRALDLLREVQAAGGFGMRVEEDKLKGSTGVFDIFTGATNFLKRYSIEDASREAEIILIHCLGTHKTAFFTDNPKISKDVIEKIDASLVRRSKGEPLQYILGYVDFLGIKIKVGKGVLIPRPETELLAEEALKTVTSNELQVTSKDKNSLLVTCRQSLSILDLCTGSGCVALALAKEFPLAYIYGTDISEVAIHYAKENAEINGIKNVTFLKGSLFEPLRELSLSI